MKIIFYFIFFIFFSCHKTYFNQNYSKKSNLKSFKKAKYSHVDNNPEQYEYIDMSLLSTAEDAFFLDDIDFYMAEKNGKRRLLGRKLGIKNTLIDYLFQFDNEKLMTDIGICRSKLIHLQGDIEDDGIVNGSNKVDSCLLKHGIKKFNFCNKVGLFEISFLDLVDWHFDDFEDAMLAFLNSCKKFYSSKYDVKSKYFTIGSSEDWRPLCDIASQYHKLKYSINFFQRYFSPFLVFDPTKDKNEDIGLITAYYLWEINVSRERSDKYWYPIYTLPPECQDRNKKCHSRSEINSGILSGRGLEILWTNDPVELYFAQIQGSCIGLFEDGTYVRLGYAGKNNHKFKSISDFLSKNVYIGQNKSYEDKLDYLRSDVALSIEATNYSDSYVFFKELPDVHVYGSMGVPLTQSRSVAIDPEFIPYGIPIYIETHFPIYDLSSKNQSKFLESNRLWFAQDTGSAIKGPIRVDQFYGGGKKAEAISKNTKMKGMKIILKPNNIEIKQLKCN